MGEITLAKILIVDQDKYFCSVLENTLTIEGGNVDAVFTGQEALRYVADRYYDVVLVDVGLPDFNGIQIIKRLKEIKNELRIIVLSDITSSGFLVEAVTAGANDCIFKPIIADDIVQSIKKLVRKDQKSLAEKNVPCEAFLLGDSPAIKRVRNDILDMSIHDAPIFIVGERGTGKEILAEELYRTGLRKAGPFVKISCAALPETLLESELFGFGKESVSGFYEEKRGLFELAHGGTLFFDGVSETSDSVRKKLFSVLEKKMVRRIGSSKEKSVDVRFIGAVNDHHAEWVERMEGCLAGLDARVIRTVPLRRRKEDIVPLSEYFIKKYRFYLRGKARGISKEVIRCFIQYDWPGNVRELEHVIEHAMVVGSRNEIILGDIAGNIRDIYYENHTSSISSDGLADGVDLDVEVANLERDLIVKALRKAENVVSTAAKFLNIKRTTLIAKMKKYGIR